MGHLVLTVIFQVETIPIQQMTFPGWLSKGQGRPFTKVLLHQEMTRDHREELRVFCELLNRVFNRRGVSICRTDISFTRKMTIDVRIFMKVLKGLKFENFKFSILHGNIKASREPTKPIFSKTAGKIP